MSYLARFLKTGGFLREGTDKTDGTPPMHGVLSVLSVTSGVDTQRSAPTLPPWPPRPNELADWPIPWRERWGEVANALQDTGVPWPEHERLAFDQIKDEMAKPHVEPVAEKQTSLFDRGESGP
jgi:hypothetical protein